jgi:uncharacterized membrane protein
VSAPFGEDAFGRAAEAAARFFGTPQYIVGQTLVVIAWIAVNTAAVRYRWDPTPSFSSTSSSRRRRRTPRR